MPKQRIPLIGNITTRFGDTLVVSTLTDQYFENVVFRVIQNEVTGGRSIKFRPSTIPTLITTTASPGHAVLAWIGNSDGEDIVCATGGTNATIYFRDASAATTYSLGTITGLAQSISETSINGIASFIIPSTDGSMWYYGADSGTGTQTFVGDLNSSTSITNVVSTTGLYVGQLVTHANIPANTRITVISGATVTISNAATATAATQTITREKLAKVIDTDYPGNQSPARTVTGQVVFLDGFGHVMCTDGTIWHFDVNSMSSIGATSFLTAGQSPDSGVTLARYQDKIMAFGTLSCEFFYNAGNTVGSVLSRVNGSTINIGALNYASVAQIGDTIVFVGVSKSLNPGVYQYSGGGLKKISTLPIDQMLSSIRSSLIALMPWLDGGKYHIAMKTGSNSTTPMIYDPEVNIWSRWNGGSTYIPIRADVTRNANVNTGVEGVFIDATGDLYKISTAGPPSPSNLTSTIVTDWFDAGTMNRKSMKSVRLIGDGLGTSSAASGFQAAISWSDVDETFSTARTVYLSNANPMLMRCGVFRRRKHKLVITSASLSTTPRQLWIEALEIDYEEWSL